MPKKVTISKSTINKNPESLDLKRFKKSGVFVNIKISHDEEIRKLNKKFFGRDFPTDVLSFNFNHINEDESAILGEIIVNYDQAVRQASEFDNDIAHELAALVEHGVLHLLGVHHPDDDEKTIHGRPV